MTVEQVKALGNKVEIVHLRTVTPSFKNGNLNSTAYEDDGFYTRQQIFDKYDDCAYPYNLGGITEVYVTTPTGQVLRGVARCSNRDNFSKKLGVKIALGRAMTSGE